MLLGKPAITLLLFHQREIAVLDDTLLRQNMDVVRLDVIQNALVIGDDNKRAFSISQRVNSVSDDLERIAICRISLRFLSPPEKPTLTDRVSRSVGISSSAIFSSIKSSKSKRSSAGCWRYLRTALTDVCRKKWLLTPGISLPGIGMREIPLHQCVLLVLTSVNLCL